MKTIDEVKDEIAQNYGYKNWNSLVIKIAHDSKFATLNKYENEAMQEYARVCCVEQESSIIKFLDGYQDICSKNMDALKNNPFGKIIVNSYTEAIIHIKSCIIKLTHYKPL